MYTLTENRTVEPTKYSGRDVQTHIFSVRLIDWFA